MDKSFVKFSIAAIFSMFMGSHVVYTIYQPMSDFHDYVRAAERMSKIKKIEANK